MGGKNIYIFVLVSRSFGEPTQSSFRGNHVCCILIMTRKWAEEWRPLPSPFSTAGDSWQIRIGFGGAGPSLRRSDPRIYPEEERSEQRTGSVFKIFQRSLFVKISENISDWKWTLPLLLARPKGMQYNGAWVHAPRGRATERQMEWAADRQFMKDAWDLRLRLFSVGSNVEGCVGVHDCDGEKMGTQPQCSI